MGVKSKVYCTDGLFAKENPYLFLFASKTNRDSLSVLISTDFIERTCKRLFNPSKLTNVHKLMLECMLLPFEFFTKRNTDGVVVN